MDNNFWERHDYLRSLTKELAMAAFQNGDITPAEYLNLQVPQKDAKTMDKALCAYRPKGTAPLDAIIKHNNNRESIELKTKNMSEEQAKYASNRPNSDFILRLIEEEKELAQKVGKLDKFIESDKFMNAGSVQRPLLWHQLKAMKKYLGLLNMRLADLLK